MLVSMRATMYQSVYKCIKKDILDGLYDIGSKLPSEAELQEMYNVSRTTVRKAVEILANEGYVYIKQGKGTTVIDHTIKQSYNQMNSFTETLRSMGYTVSIRNLSISRMWANAEIAKQLEVEEGHELVCIQRIPLASGRPAAIIANYIPSELVLGIESYEKEIVSLYRFLGSHYNITIDTAHDVITARTATFEQSCLLECNLGAPLLYTRRVCYSGGRPVSYDLVYALSEIGGGGHEKPVPYQIEITLRGKPQF